MERVCVSLEGRVSVDLDLKSLAGVALDLIPSDQRWLLGLAGRRGEAVSLDAVSLLNHMF